MAVTDPKRSSFLTDTSSTGHDEVHTTQEHRVRWRFSPVKPPFYKFDGNTEVVGKFMFAAKNQAGFVKRLDVDVRVLCGGWTNVFHVVLLLETKKPRIVVE